MGVNISFLVTGFILGLSVAWPPGPINAEIMRRGLGYGFRPAVFFGAGACIGDVTWAIVAGSGAAILAGYNAFENILRPLSGLILIGLAVHYAYGAMKAYRQRKDNNPVKPISVTGGFFVALTLALTSPWNLAFWLGVVGQPGLAEAGSTGLVVLAAGVMLGTISWVIFLSGITAYAHKRVGGAAWDIAARAMTALVLGYFGVRMFWL